MAEAFSETADYLGQEPCPALGLIDPDLNQAGRSDVIVFLTDLMGGTEASCELLVVGSKFCQHVFRGDYFRVVVFQALKSGNVADGVDGGPTDLARSFRNVIRHGEDLLGLLVEQQVVIAEMAPAHVPVEIL